MDSISTTEIKKTASEQNNTISSKTTTEVLDTIKLNPYTAIVVDFTIKNRFLLLTQHGFQSLFNSNRSLSKRKIFEMLNTDKETFWNYIRQNLDLTQNEKDKLNNFIEANIIDATEIRPSVFTNQTYTFNKITESPDSDYLPIETTYTT